MIRRGHARSVRHAHRLPAARFHHQIRVVANGHQRLGRHIQRVLRRSDRDFARRVHAGTNATARRVKRQLHVVGRHAAGIAADRGDFVNLAVHLRIGERVHRNFDLLVDGDLHHVQFVHGNGQVHILAFEDGAHQRAAGDFVALAHVQRGNRAVARRKHDQVLAPLLRVLQRFAGRLALQAQVFELERNRRIRQLEERVAALDGLAHLGAHAFNRAAVGGNGHRLVDRQRARAERHAVRRRDGDGFAHRQAVILNGEGQRRALPRQIDNRAFRREILAGDDQLIVQRHARARVHAAQLGLHAPVRGDDGQRALAAEHRQRIVADACVNRHHAPRRRSLHRRDLRAGAGVQNGIVQLPEVKLQIGDFVVQIGVGQHGQNVARLHLVADAHAQVGQRAVRAREHMGLVARGGRARAVNGFLHRAAGHCRAGIAFALVFLRLFADIGLEAEQPRADRQHKHDDDFHRFADDLARPAALFLSGVPRRLCRVQFRFMHILFAHEIHPPGSY